MKKQTYIPTLLITVLLGFCMEAQATLLFYEGFDYGATSSSSLTTSSAGTWEVASGSGDVNYDATSLSYGTLTTSGGSARATTSNGSGTLQYDFTDLTGFSSGDEVWISYLVASPGTIGGNTQASAGITIQRNSWGSISDYKVGKQWGNSTSLEYYPNYVDLSGAEYATSGANAVMILMYIPYSGNAEIWVNPDLDTAPTLGTGQSFGGQSQITFISRAMISFTNHELAVDEFRIGTTFGDVSPIPEPGALSLVAIAGCVFLLSRRFRRNNRR